MVAKLEHLVGVSTQDINSLGAGERHRVLSMVGNQIAEGVQEIAQQHVVVKPQNKGAPKRSKKRVRTAATNPGA